MTVDASWYIKIHNTLSKEQARWAFLLILHKKKRFDIVSSPPPSFLKVLLTMPHRFAAARCLQYQMSFLLCVASSFSMTVKIAFHLISRHHREAQLEGWPSFKPRERCNSILFSLMKSLKLDLSALFQGLIFSRFVPQCSSRIEVKLFFNCAKGPGVEWIVDSLYGLLVLLVSPHISFQRLHFVYILVCVWPFWKPRDPSWVWHYPQFHMAVFQFRFC